MIALILAGIAIMVMLRSHSTDSLWKTVIMLVMLGPLLATSIALVSAVISGHPWLTGGVMVIVGAALVGRRSKHDGGGHGGGGHGTSMKRRVSRGSH
jgi:hypothetical protein